MLQVSIASFSNYDFRELSIPYAATGDFSQRCTQTSKVGSRVSQRLTHASRDWDYVWPRHVVALRYMFTALRMSVSIRQLDIR